MALRDHTLGHLSGWALWAALAVVLFLKSTFEEHWMHEKHPAYAAYRLRSKRIFSLVVLMTPLFKCCLAKLIENASLHGANATAFVEDTPQRLTLRITDADPLTGSKVAAAG